MPILPNVFAYFAFWMLIGPLSITNIVLKLAFVDLSIIPSKFSPAVFQVVLIFALKRFSIKRAPHSLSFSLSHHKLPLKYTSVLPLISSGTMELPFKKTSNKHISIWLLLNSLSVLQTFNDFAFIGLPIFGHHNSLASPFSLLEAANIFVSLIINMFSKAMRLPVHPLAIITHEAMTPTANYLDHSSSTPIPITEPSQIVIFIWHVLKTQSCLFRFA